MTSPRRRPGTLPRFERGSLAQLLGLELAGALSRGHVIEQVTEGAEFGLPEDQPAGDQGAGAVRSRDGSDEAPNLAGMPWCCLGG
ncbi:MAG: hypothetical protein ACYDC5_11240, partial [Candidatus Dormibacteria bacterium]